MNKTYSPQDFRRALATNTLDDQPTLEGMAKADEHDDGVLLFSVADCERWTPIPLELVFEIEHLGRMRCKDHEHPRVRIHLPRLETPAAKMLAGLLDAHVTALRSAARAARVPTGRDAEDCQAECGGEYQSCIEGCDPRDAGCFYGCKRRLSRCMGRCR